MSPERSKGEKGGEQERKEERTYLQWDDVILTHPEHYVFVDRIGNLNLKAPIIDGSGGGVVHG